MKSIAVLAVLVLLAGISFPATVSSCVNITSPGTYTLNQSISGAPNDATAEFGFPAQACMKIYSPNVTFDCAGFSITGPGGLNTTAGIIINDSASPGVIVQNCPAISAYTYGTFGRGNGSIVRNSTAFGNTNYGFDTFLSSFNVLDSDTAYGNAFGFFIDEGTNNNVTNSVAHDNTQRGFEDYLGRSDFFSLDQANNSVRGFSLRSTSGVVVTGSNVSGNNYSGIYLESATGSDLSGDIASGNCGTDGVNNGSSAPGNDGSGFLLNGSSGNVLFADSSHNNCGGMGGNGSVVGGNGGNGYGFELLSSNGNFLNSDLGFSNTGGLGGISAGVVGGTGGNGYGFGLITSDGNVFTGCLANGNVGGTGTSATDIGGQGGNAYGYSIAGGQNNDLENSSSNNNVGGTAGAATAGGSLGGEGGFGDGYFLGSGTSTTALNNLTNDVSFQNTGGPGAQGLAANGSGGPGEGFMFEGVDSALLFNDTSHDNCGGVGFGSQFGGRGAGFFMFTGSNGVTILNSTSFNNCGGAGTSPGDGEGFSIDGASSGVFSNDTATSNMNSGFELFDSFSNTLSGDSAGSNAKDGFDISGDGSNTFSGDTAALNGLDGFSIGFFSMGDTFSNDTAFNNTARGIEVNGANGTAISSSHLFGNDPDFMANGSQDSITLSGVFFDSPSGTFTNYTNLSVSDILNDGYSINWSAQPAALPPSKASFDGKFVNITNQTPNTTIQSVTFSWTQAEVTAGNYNAGDFALYDYNGTWNVVNNTPDVANAQLSMSNVSDFSDYGILEATFTPPSGGGGTSGGGSSPSLSLSFDSGNDVATVTSGGSPVPGATVKENGTVVGTTDSNGQITVPGCGAGATIDALLSGYNAASAAVTLMACSAPPACTTDDNCSSTQACMAGACVAVSCPNGTVTNHQCVLPQNATQNNTQCTGPSCCTSSTSCSDTQACVSGSGAPATAASPGSCQEVTGQCGYAANHAFVPYNYTCGSEPGCPSCPGGQACVAHQCVQYGLSCPTGGTVGSSITCNATQNGSACPNCEYTVTDPTGATTSGQTGPDGGISVPLNSAGQYMVSVMNAGASVSSMNVVASAPAQQPPSAPTAPATAASGPDYTWVLLLVLLILIAGGAYLYMRGRK